jgi:hypothetical protein
MPISMPAVAIARAVRQGDRRPAYRGGRYDRSTAKVAPVLGWGAVVALGAAGGLIVELVALWRRLTAWQADLCQLDQGAAPPRFSAYVNPQVDGLVALTRLLLGAVAGALCHSQITGAPAAIAIGASAPSLLSQLGGALRRDNQGLPSSVESMDATEAG